MLACILVDIPEYDNIVCVLSRAKSEELLISLLRRIKSCFPHGTFVCKVGVHRFALFSGGFAGANELLESVTGSMKEIASLGRQYEEQLSDRPLDVYAGIDFESNHDGIEMLYTRGRQLHWRICRGKRQEKSHFIRNWMRMSPVMRLQARNRRI